MSTLSVTSKQRRWLPFARASSEMYGSAAPAERSLALSQVTLRSWLLGGRSSGDMNARSRRNDCLLLHRQARTSIGDKKPKTSWLWYMPCRAAAIDWLSELSSAD